MRQPTLFPLPEPERPPEPPPVYAVNISDLTILAQGPLNFAALLLADFCDQASPLATPHKDRFDEDSIILDGPATLDAARTHALIALLVTVIGPRRLNRPIRCYRRGPRGGRAHRGRTGITAGGGSRDGTSSGACPRAGAGLGAGACPRACRGSCT